MTDREIRQAKTSLVQLQDGESPVLMEAKTVQRNELWCREMINSILTYHGIDGLYDKSGYWQEYLDSFVVSLGADRVQELCEEQVADFRKAVVLENVEYDSEGVSYNSVVWADELIAQMWPMFALMREEGPEHGFGYTLPDGKYHVFAYVDVIKDERVIVFEPNEVVDGAHEPIGGDTYIISWDDPNEIPKACMWCFEVFAEDRYGFDRLIDATGDRVVGDGLCEDVKDREGDYLR